MLLYWLNKTCGDLLDWHGLSKNWAEQVSFLWVGNITDLYGDNITEIYGDDDDINNDYPYYPLTTKGYDKTPCLDSYTCQYFDKYKQPPVALSTCRGFNSSIWETNLYNSSEAALVVSGTPGEGYSPFYDPSETYDPGNDWGVYLDQKGFCNDTYYSIDQACSGAGRTAILLWAISFCDAPSVFVWPENWRDTLALMNSSYLDQATFGWPSCLNTDGCSDILNNTEANCSTVLCDLDSTGSNCPSISAGFKPPCFCKPRKASPPPPA